MSKFNKLVNNPNLFFKDAIKNKLKKKHPIMNTNKKLEQKFFTNNSHGLNVKNSKKKTPQEYLKELTDFIEAFDVNSLRINKEYIWPFLRNHLWTQLYFLGFGKKAKELVPHRLQLGTNVNIPYHLRRRFRQKYSAVEIDEIPEEKEGIDFLFLTVVNASEQVELENGEIYYRIIDPMFEAAAKIGTAKKIEFLKVNSPAIKKINTYKYKPTVILPPHICKFGFSESIQFHHSFFDLINRKIPSLEISADDVKDLIDWEMHTRDYYLRVLGKIRPKVLFLNGFHYHAPMISAAHALGVKTIDLQHGIQVGWNPLYNNWEELPCEGYQGLPDYFFVWGEKEFKSITKVFNTESKHKPVIYGNPWLEKQIEYMGKLEKKLANRFNLFPIKILLILQNQREIPGLYKEIIENSPNCLWIVRHHPKGNKFKAKDFYQQNINNIIISKHIDTVSLGSLFEHVDIVVSEGSTVAIEADYYGVKNIICSDDGRKNYLDEIEAGQFYYIETHEEFIDCLNSLDLENRSSRVNTYNKINIEEVLLEIISN